MNKNHIIEALENLACRIPRSYELSLLAQKLDSRVVHHCMDTARRSKEIFQDQKLLEKLRTFLTETKDDWNYITPEQFHKEDKNQYFILDIRRPEDFAKGHIPGATNIFWLDLLKPENLEKLPRNEKILVYCYVGHTSSQALVLLKLLGYDAVGLKFGMGKSPVEGVPIAGWTDFGYETTKTASDKGVAKAPYDVTFDQKGRKYLLHAGKPVKYQAQGSGGDYKVQFFTDTGTLMGMLSFDNKVEFEREWDL